MAFGTGSPHAARLLRQAVLKEREGLSARRGSKSHFATLVRNFRTGAALGTQLYPLVREVRDVARRWLDKRRSVTGYLVKDVRSEEKRS